jgi:hypothetical protein
MTPKVTSFAKQTSSYRRASLWFVPWTCYILPDQHTHTHTHTHALQMSRLFNTETLLKAYIVSLLRCRNRPLQSLTLIRKKIRTSGGRHPFVLIAWLVQFFCIHWNNTTSKNVVDYLYFYMFRPGIGHWPLRRKDRVLIQFLLLWVM